MTVFFAHTFGFAYANAELNNALQIIWDVVLKVVPVAYTTSLARRKMMMNCAILIFQRPKEVEMSQDQMYRWIP